MNHNVKSNNEFSFEPQIHSYSQVMERMCAERQKNLGVEIQNENTVTTISFIPKQKKINSCNNDVETAGTQEKDMQKTATETKNEDVAPIHRVIDRDNAKTFTEYVLSRPVTFAHKCEDVMATCSVLAIMAGLGAIGAVANPEIIPSNEKVALGFVCAMGACLAAMTVSGIVGGISDYFDDRKKRMLQEVKAYYRD